MARPSRRPEPADDDLNPNRAAELRRAAEHTRDVLRGRGIRLDGRESPDELADLLTAVERFEASVAILGGDSMVNTPQSSAPEDPALVPPTRGDREPVGEYIARVNQAASELPSPGPPG